MVGRCQPNPPPACRPRHCLGCAPAEASIYSGGRITPTLLHDFIESCSSRVRSGWKEWTLAGEQRLASGDVQRIGAARPALPSTAAHSARSRSERASFATWHSTAHARTRLQVAALPDSTLPATASSFMAPRATVARRGPLVANWGQTKTAEAMCLKLCLGTKTSAQKAFGPGRGCRFNDNVTSSRRRLRLILKPSRATGRLALAPLGSSRICRGVSNWGPLLGPLVTIAIGKTGPKGSVALHGWGLPQRRAHAKRAPCLGARGFPTKFASKAQGTHSTLAPLRADQTRQPQVKGRVALARPGFPSEAAHAAYGGRGGFTPVSPIHKGTRVSSWPLASARAGSDPTLHERPKGGGVSPWHR